MDNQIEQVKSHIDIVEYIGLFTPLKKAGRHFKGLCPFHQEKTASFVVSPDRQMWYCFGACHVGGDVISFAMKYENITFYEALRDLAERAGVKLEAVGFEDTEWNRKERLLKINALATQFFEYILHSTKFGKTAQDYLKNRKISEPIMKKFRLGYAPRSWDSLLRFLKKHGFTDEELAEAGMVVRTDGGRIYDRFRGRVMFPIFDIRGNIIGFSGRILEGEGEAKYVNTPETPVYHKRESLYGIHIAKDAIRKLENVILVEGEFDMISLYIHGIEHVVAIKGSAVTREQLTILKRLTKKITFSLDADAAGEDAMKRGIEEAERQEFEIHVLHSDQGKDPDEIMRTDPVHFKKMMQSPMPIYDFLITLAQKKFPEGNAFSKKNIADFVVPYIFRITNPIVQSYYRKKIASLLEVDEGSVGELLRKQRFNQQERTVRTVRQKQKEQVGRDEMLQKYLISRMFQHEKPYELAESIFADIAIDDFTIPSIQKVCSSFMSYKNEHHEFDPKQFALSLPAELQPVYDELYLYGSSDSGFQNEPVQHLILEVRRDALKKKMSQLLNTESAEDQKENQLAALSQTLKEVEIRMQSV